MQAVSQFPGERSNFFFIHGVFFQAKDRDNSLPVVVESPQQIENTISPQAKANYTPEGVDEKNFFLFLGFVCFQKFESTP